MIRNGVLLGVVAFARFDPGGFGDDEISLLKTFTDQAAIAVDNARLLREIEERNNELAESLELQTATSEILQLISDNPGNLDAVFQGIVTQAAQLCDADAAAIMRREGDELVVSDVSGQLTGEEVGTRLPVRPDVDYREPIFIDDLWVLFPGTVTAGRSIVTVGMFVDDNHFGQINVNRTEVRPFEPHHGRIVQTFAEQAARSPSPTPDLFNDLDAALERQTAMTDVLDAVSTARLDLQPVFDKVAEHADRLCRGTGAMVLVRDGDELLHRAQSPDRRRSTPTASATASCRSTTRRSPAQPCCAARSSTSATGTARTQPPTPTSPARTMGHQSALAVPMMRGGAAIGTIGFTRAEPGGYTDDEIALLETFADQAAIAVDNARLLREIEQRNTELVRVARAADGDVGDPAADQRQPRQPRRRLRRHRDAGSAAVRRRHVRASCGATVMNSC